MSMTSSSEARAGGAEAGEGLIVAGVDGSDSSMAALRWAARQAQLTGARLHVIEAWSTMNMALMTPHIDFEAEARETLEHTVDDIRKEFPDVSVTGAALFGPPSRVLVDATGDADLLVVGSQGRGAFTGMLLGSVSQHCVQQANCPVVVVRG
jgi:nucleotide-binding universal stress UspA family protein